MAGDIFNGWPEDGEPVPGSDFEVCRVGTTQELHKARRALLDIITMKSCLLADAQAIAKEALRGTE